MKAINKTCANCSAELQFLKREHMQLGKTSLLLGDWPNLLAGALDVEFWVCPECRKLDFYLSETEEGEDGSIAKITCPACGVEHDLDDPRCPRCGAKNTQLY